MSSHQLLVLALALAPVLPAQEKGGKLEGAAQKSVTEPRTGIEFPVALPVLGGSATHTLAGVGVRTRTVFNVKAYAVGFYVDAPAALAALRRHSELKAENAEKDKQFAADIVAGDFGKTLRLVMARDVSAEDMAEAFSEQLEPRMKGKSKPEDLEETGKILATFRGYFGESMKVGDEIVFTFTPAARVTTTINGQQKGAIESRTLAWALFDIYLGEKAISASARQAFLRGMREHLGRHRGGGGQKPEGQAGAQGAAPPGGR